jgi:predicted DNA-binding helix-hairpin-helix protein
VLGEQSLRRILRSYFAYYHDSRCHLALDKDSPQTREVRPADKGIVVEIPRVGRRASSSLRALRSLTALRLSQVKPSGVAIVERRVCLKINSQFPRASLHIGVQPK